MKTVFNTEAFIRNVSASFGWWCLFREQFEYIVRMKRNSNWGGNKKSKHDLIVLRILSYQERKSTAAKAQVLIRSYQVYQAKSPPNMSTGIYFDLLCFFVRTFGPWFSWPSSQTWRIQICSLCVPWFHCWFAIFARFLTWAVTFNSLNWIAESLPQIQGKQFGMCRVSR